MLALIPTAGAMPGTLHFNTCATLIQAADGYLPLWMSTRLEQGQTWALAKWEELSADGSLKQAKEAAAPYLEQANVYLTQAQQAAAPYVAQAQVGVALAGALRLQQGAGRLQG